jgi:hypothetical protein
MLTRSRTATPKQLNSAGRHKAPKRLAFNNFDRFVFASLYRLAPGVLNALVILKPETVIRWHRAGFRLFWRWRSRSHGGRPKVPHEIRQLIREMSLANPLWGAPRIHGELLKLSIAIGQTSVAKYMARHVPLAAPAQSRGQLLFHNRFAKAAHSAAQRRLDRVKPIVEKPFFARPLSSLRGISLHGVISIGVGARRFGLGEHPGDYATFKFQPLPLGHLRGNAVFTGPASG